MPGAELVPASLLRARDLVHPALQEAVGQLSAPLARIAGYHLGWLDSAGAPIATHGGKALRPTLALLGAQAAGGRIDQGLPAAVAVELVHNFSLLHDDIMDDDTERRHRPTAWTVFGRSEAILAGDALVVLAGQVLADVPGERSAAATRRLAAATQRLVDGQYDDLAFERRLDVGLEECLGMAHAKTAALLGCSAALGAVLVGGSSAVVDVLAEYGNQLGMAFQLVDDLLGIWGTPEATGKPVLSDLRAHKKSVPVCVALGAGGTSAAELRRLLARDGEPDGEDLVLMAKLVEDAGGRDWTAAEAGRRLDAALAALDGAALSSQVHAELVEIAHFVTTRAA